MEELPLNPAIYHSRTQPAHDYFYPNLRKGNEKMAFSSQNCESHSRVLLLVFPPPGDMALNSIQQYTKFSENDTVVYVGEGRGGANGNDKLFDLLESGEWVLLRNIDLSKLSSSKGFERLFLLKRIPKILRKGTEGPSDKVNLDRVLEYKK
jgi:hypothetical protein